MKTRKWTDFLDQEQIKEYEQMSDLQARIFLQIKLDQVVNVLLNFGQRMDEVLFDYEED